MTPSAHPPQDSESASHRSPPEGTTQPGGSRRNLGWLAAFVIAAAAVLALLFLGPWRETRVVPPPPDTVRLTELPASAVGISLSLHPDQIFRTLEASVPLRLGDLSNRSTYPADTLATYAFLAEREPFITELRGDTVHLSTVIRYGAQVWYSTPFGVELTASCGISATQTLGPIAPRAVVGFSTPLGVDEDWRVRSAVRVDQVAPLTVDDRCVVSLLQFEMDVTEAILLAAEGWLQEQAGQVDQAVAGFPIDAHLEAYWASLSQPIQMADDIWFVLSPERIRPGDGAGERGEEAAPGAEIVLTSRPRIVLGSEPMSGSTDGVPPEGWLRDFAAGTDLPVGPDPVEPPGSVVLEWRAEYATLSTLLTQWVGGGDHEFMGRRVEIVGVEVSSNGDGRMAFDFDLTAPIQGRVHINGTPVIDPATGELVLADLDVGATTGGLPARFAVWVVGKAFPHHLRNRARWSLEDALSTARAAAEMGLNRRVADELTLEGSLGPIEPTEVGATDDAFVLRTVMDVDARMVIGEE